MFTRPLTSVHLPGAFKRPSRIYHATRTGLRVSRPLPRAFSETALRRHDITTHDVQVRPNGLQIVGPRGSHVKRAILPHFWLRDNCRCSSCVNQETMQRNFNTFAISENIKPQEVASEVDGLRVTWNEDGHESFYPWKFLNFYLRNDSQTSEQVNFQYWGAEVASGLPSVEHKDLMAPDNESGIAKLTQLIREYGFAFVNGTPCETPDATKEALEKIAFIRETHYGGFYDFVPDMAFGDTAYTNIALPAHTDTTYFTDPAGLQAFHMLSHEAPPGSPIEGELGGKSLLVDGFYAAGLLQEEDPRAFEILSKLAIPWHASGNQGITISPDKRYPVFEVDETTGRLARLRWNNDDRGVVPFADDISPTEWYDAARKWNTIITRPDVECWVQLRPGQVLIFDNWRVMHGRSSFEGRRRMCGAYINRDDFISRWRNTNFPRDHILSQVVG